MARVEERGLIIWYDKDCLFCLKMCRLIATFFFLRDVPICPAQDDPQIGPVLEANNSWVVSDGDGKHLRWAAMCRLVAASPVFRPLALLMQWRVFSKIGDAVYVWIGDHRPQLARVSDAFLPFRTIRLRSSRVSSAFGMAALVFITIQNISTLPVAGVQLPQTFLAVRQALGLYQDWTMFAPYPELRSPWPTIRGETDR